MQTRRVRRTASSEGRAWTTGGDGWADVWKRHHFAWEYKGRRANLDAAFNQLRQYALALENPPLLIVSDIKPAVPGPAGFGERVSRRHKLR